MEFYVQPAQSDIIYKKETVPLAEIIVKFVQDHQNVINVRVDLIGMVVYAKVVG